MNKRKYLIAVAGVIFAFAGCNNNDNNDNSPGAEPDPEEGTVETGLPVETNPANTSYPPAFTGQTRIGSVTTETPYQATIVTSSLVAPWGITVLPDGRFIITEKGGTMRIVTGTGTIGSALTGIPAVNDAGQGGLLGVCIDPDFGSNRMVYWAFSEPAAGGARTAVAKGRLADNESGIENTTVIYRANPAAGGGAHFGGRVIFDTTGNLIVSSGERANLATRPLAQSVTDAIGKVLRITTNGLPAPGNPTFSQSGALPELYSIGHRNPQGLALHPVTGEIWQSEHGPRGGDEINRLQAGSNYGWPVITYGLEYSGQAIGSAIQQQDGMQQPVYYWDPVISPSGITFYKGTDVPEWENNLFICSLSATHIARLVIQQDVVVGEERLLAGENQRFRDIIQGTDHALYAITDAGRLYRIARQ
jgi:glucose/arabinose dehydrogenase